MDKNTISIELPVPTYEDIINGKVGRFYEHCNDSDYEDFDRYNEYLLFYESSIEAILISFRDITDYSSNTYDIIEYCNATKEEYEELLGKLLKLLEGEEVEL